MTIVLMVLIALVVAFAGMWLVERMKHDETLIALGEVVDCADACMESHHPETAVELNSALDVAREVLNYHVSNGRLPDGGAI